MKNSIKVYFEGQVGRLTRSNGRLSSTNGHI